MRAWFAASIIATPMLLATSPSRADDPQQHFAMGVKLFQARNFAGALAEFEEAYRLKPTASSLQNIALCQRALFRYAEAIATLEKMLREHEGAVDAEDRRAAREAIDEMRPLVATVRLSVSPPEATVTIDGRAIPGGESREVRLNVGEHRIVAEAPRHRRLDLTQSFAGGPRQLAIRLDSDTGELTVVVDDAEAAIAIDGVPRSFGTWSGELPAGDRHVIQVYKTGFTTTTLEVTLEPGKPRTVRASLGPPTRDPRVQTPFPYRPPSPQLRGFYGLLTSTGYVLNGDPDGFRSPRNEGRDGTYFGLRFGYRFTTTFGLEVMAEAGKHNIGPGCYTPPKAPDECAENPPNGFFYSLVGRRFGVNGRFMTAGERFRFMAAAGVGGAHHTLSMPVGAGDTRPGGEGSALNAYGFAEAGIELNFGHALVGGVLAIAVDGVNNLAIGPSSTRVFTSEPNINMAGLGIRVGYGGW